MKQYRVFRWDKKDNLIYLGENIIEDQIFPGSEMTFEDSDEKEKDWIVSEVLFPNPREFQRPDGSTYSPDPIVILRPE